MIGGYDGANVPTEILALAGNGSSRPFGHLVHGVRYAATAVSGHTAYVFGGEVLGRELDTVQAVDLAHRSDAGGGPAAGPARTRDGGHGRRSRPADGRSGRARPADRGDVVVRPRRRAGSPGRAGSRRPLSDAAVAAFGHRIWLLGGEDPAVTAGVLTISVR